MKKLTVRKDKECMACLACVQACSEAFYKVMDPGKSCIQIVEKNGVENRLSACSAENARKPAKQERLPRTQRACT